MYKLAIALYVLMVMSLVPSPAGAAPPMPGGVARGQGTTAEQPLAKDEILDLVQAGMDSGVLAKKVEKLGISFVPTEDYYGTLRKAGAQEVLITALKNASKPQPLSKEQLLKLVAGGTVQQAIAQVKQYGIDFMADDKFIHLLRLAGADDNLIAAVRGTSTTTTTTTTTTGGGLTPGTARENTRDGLKYVWVPAGTYMMGCSPDDTDCLDDEKPAHSVTVSNGFWMGQTEITAGAFKHFVAETGHAMPAEPKFGDRSLNPGMNNNSMPMVGLSWATAQAYCVWAGGRLPTEAEWEYAARGGTSGPRYGDVEDISWGADNSGKSHLDSTKLWTDDQKTYFDKLDDNANGLHEVALKRPNAWGLFDILGNASEWVQDWYDENYYKTSPGTDPGGPATGTKRVLRSWNWFSSPFSIRASHRGPTDPTSEGNACGARCVMANLP
jgi:formylglycine-generating enzyme required for sulfatase activity